jgi:hypothetical protein
MKLQKRFGQIFIRKFWPNFHPKATDVHLS